MTFTTTQQSESETSLTESDNDIDSDQNSEDSGDLELLEMIKESSDFNSSKNPYEVRQLDAEDIPLKIPTPRKQIVNQTANNDYLHGIDFTSMQKADQPITQGAHVIHNDLDLRTLHKTFVRNKKLKLQKMKTDEHTDEESNSLSDSSDSDGEFVVAQGNFFHF